MTHSRTRAWLTAVATAAALALVTQVAVLARQMDSTGNDLGSVHIARAVIADGEPLAPGTYTLRLSPAAVAPVVGESPSGSRWIEFVQAGAVKGRELATVLAGDDVKKVAKTAPPTPGRVRVELLQGGGYLRVWVNHAGTQYLVHLVVAPRGERG